MSTKGQGEAVEAGRALGQGRTLGGVQNAKEENDRKEITGKNTPGRGMTGVKPWRKERARHAPGTDHCLTQAGPRGQRVRMGPWW